MKIRVNDKGTIEVTEVYSSIILISDSGEQLAVCMRDTGFEFRYQGKWHSAKKGSIKELNY